MRMTIVRSVRASASGTAWSGNVDVTDLPMLAEDGWIVEAWITNLACTQVVIRGSAEDVLVYEGARVAAGPAIPIGFRAAPTVYRCTAEVASGAEMTLSLIFKKQRAGCAQE